MKKLCFVCGVMALATCAFAADLSIPITVQEPLGIARKSAPVSGGIPLPWGVYNKPSWFALYAGDQRVPAQVEPLVTDEKGFFRWVLLDFQTDLKPNEKKTFILKFAAPIEQPVGTLARNTGNGVEVDTGKIRFTIAKDKPFTLFSTVAVDGKPLVVGGEVSYTDVTKEEVRHVADKPKSIVVEYNGPMRTTICVRAHFLDDEQTKLTAIARITAWKGRSDVYVKYTLANSNPEHYTYRRIKDSTVELKFAADHAGTMVGAAKPLEVAGGAVMTQGLHTSSYRQDVKGHTKVVSGDKLVWEGVGPKDTPQGWIGAKVGGQVVYACDRYFVHDLPRRLGTTKNSLLLTGITERFDGPEITWRGKKVRIGHPWNDKVRWLCDCTHITSHYMIDFAAPADPARLSEMAKTALDRLHAMAPPAWYFETEGLSVGKFGTQADELKCYDLWKWKYDKRRIPTRSYERRRYVKSEDNHYETEEDIVEAIVIMYLRTGGRAFYNAAEAWANNNMDLQAWRTDGWRWRDGGVWWTAGGPAGNRPQRDKDPISGRRNGLPAVWAKDPSNRDLGILANSKACYCHNWGAGIAQWFCVTGDRDALETAIDNVEQNIDTQVRAFRKAPGSQTTFSRDFTRSCRLTNATRLIAPNDEFVREASDLLAQIFFKRKIREPRGLVNPAVQKLDMMKFKYEDYVGKEGMEAKEKLGIIIDPYNGALTDFRTRPPARWLPVIYPHQWMFPPLSRAMECYYRVSGNEDALDYFIAYGQGVAHLFYQENHYAIHHKLMLDFPKKGICKDYASWTQPKNKRAKGIEFSGYLTLFHPDIPGRAYQYTGEEFLKQRAFLIWEGGSHRGYQAKDMHRLGGVGTWVNCNGPHSESVGFTGKTFYIWANPKKDPEPPKPIKDLTVKVEGDKATVSFTAPADEGGGKVVRYQVKYSDKPIVSYQDFLKLWAKNQDAKHCNWWMAVNLHGEPKPRKPGEKEFFTVTGLDEDIAPTYFAVRSFDDSHNRSMVSNVAQPGK